MAVKEQVELIEYSKSVDYLNCATHAVGAVLAAGALAAAVVKAGAHSGRAVFSALVYCLSLLAVYTISAVYHGLPKGEAKRRARLADHTAIPVLLAGTATPCALITLYDISIAHSMLVFCLAWFCALFGIISKLFFFQKLKAACIVVYIAGSAVMLASCIPLLGSIDNYAFGLLLLGCTAYLIGAVFCGLGIKRPCLHAVFHLFVLAGSAIHYYVIYAFVL